MAEQYTVNYQINVQSDPALQAIRKFQEATAQLEGLTRRFDVVARSIGKVNAAFASINSKPVNIQVNTANAEAGLNRVLTLLGRIKSRSQSVLASNVRVTGGAKGSTTVGGMGTVSTRSATTDLKNLQKTIADTQNAINRINKRYINPKARTQTAISSLEALLKKIGEVEAKSKITITASAAGASAAVAGGAAGTRRTNPSSGTRQVSPTNGRWLGWQGGSHQYLGNVYAGTGTVIGADMLKGFGVMYGLSSLFSGVGSVIRDAVAYNNVSQTTKNILGTHDKEPNFEGRFNAASQLMRQVGIETKFTAVQVAEAGKFLAMAGYNVDDIRNAIRPISNIALVGDTDLGETADITTNIMTSYQIPATRMNNAADILTMTFTKTNTTLEDLAESFKYAGTVAHQSGLSFETASAALGVLGDAGIQGSHAGTTLRMMLMNMQNPTKRGKKAWAALGIKTKDENGDLRDFNDILRDLNEKRNKMGAGEFQSLINQMFRVTAAPGALALIQNADKVRQVTDLNTYNSTGLSEDLANAKKNTLEGKWYQFTSSFMETGMQQFEAMEGQISSFLDRMTNMMKSGDFANTLNAALKVTFQVLEDIAWAANLIFAAVSGIAKYLSWIFDIPGLGWALKHFIGIQMALSAIVGSIKMIVSLKASLFAVTKLNVFVKLVEITTNRVKALVIAMGMLKGMSFMQGLRNFPSIFSFAMKSPLARGAGTIAGAVGAGAAAQGAGSVVGAAGGAATGAAMSGLGSIATIGKAVGSFLFTNPVGWGVLAAAAIGYVGYQIYDTIQKTNEARDAALRWADSFKTLGVSEMHVESMNDVIIGNMRLSASVLATEQEKLRESIDLYDRYWAAKNGGTKEENKDKTKYTETDAGIVFKGLMDNADQWFGVDKIFTPYIEKLLFRKDGAGYSDLVKSEWATDRSGNSVNKRYWIDMYGGKLRIPLGSSGKINEAAAVQLALAHEGANPENANVQKLEQYLITHATRAKGYEDMRNVLNNAEKTFMPSTYLTQWNPGISSEQASEMTQYDVEHSMAFVYAQRDLMKRIIQGWLDLGKLEEQFDKGQQLDLMSVQRIIANRFGILLDPTLGLFGTPEWLQKVQNALRVDANGNSRSIEQMTFMVNETFTGLANWMNELPAKYRPIFSRYLNRSYWEQMLQGVGGNGDNLAAGGYYPGKKEGETAYLNGKKYKWTLSGVAKDGGLWVDEKGNVYSPEDATKSETPLKTWKPTTGGASGVHLGDDESKYKNKYQNLSAAPKQVIVRIENLMRVDKQTIDMSDERQAAAVQTIKEQLATALLDVVQDFNANIV